MKINQRQSLVQRLLSNYRICKIGNNEYVVKNPSLDLIYRSHVVYEEALHETRFEPWLREETALNILLRRNLWKHTEDAYIKTLETNLENLKIEIYKNAFRDKKVKKLRKSIQLVNKQIDICYGRKNALGHYTWEEFAITQKTHFILRNTVYDINGKQLVMSSDDDRIDYFLLQKIIKSLNQQKLDTEQYRIIARTDPWQHYWKIGKPNPFSCDVLELNDEQRLLVTYSSFYDAVFQHHEKPSDKVIEDDDMVDGWMILKKREQDQEMNKKQVENQIGNRHANAQEIFIPVESVEEARNVEAMNTHSSSVVKQQRHNLVKNKGEAKDAEFFDRRVEMNRQSQSQFRNHIKGK